MTLRRVPHAVLALIALGTAIRLGIAFWSTGTFFDLDSYAVVDRGLSTHGLHVYSAINGFVIRWPYPPGYFPVIGLVKTLATATGVDFHQLMRVPPIAADAGLAWLVQHMVARRGGSGAARIGATAAIALGPIFAGTSSYQGQLDSVAILPAVGALAVWDRAARSDRRAVGAGLLIGLGATFKTAPILMLVALAPLARSRRELALLVGGALAIPALTLAPFAIADPHGVAHALRYHGLPGLGGLSLLSQPNLPLDWLTDGPVRTTGFAQTLTEGAVFVLLPALAAFAFTLQRRKATVRPVTAVAILWLVFYVFGVNFLMQYLVWGLPFLVLAAGWRWTLAAQLALTPAMLLVFLKTDSHALVWLLYTGPLILMWAAGAALLVRAARSRPTASRAA
ncbi:MAG: hypothetical protein QOG41_1332 [Thermoleophilaceae bacterium]|nr:hypothetical protein [Thermoleophilaceae bacterium]